MSAWKHYDDAPDFNEFREDMERRFKNTPLICVVNIGSSYDTNHYGPFKDGKEAMDWMGKQPIGVRFGFLPLRNPWLERKHNDFYFTPPDMVEREYDHTSHIPTFLKEEAQ